MNPHLRAWVWGTDHPGSNSGSPTYQLHDYVVVQSLSHFRLFVTPWTAAHQSSLSFIISWSLLKLLSIELVMPSNHLILCRPILLLPSVLPSIRVISNELALRIRWPKYWSFSFGISPSNVYSELISFLASCLNFLYKMRIIAVPISQCCCEDKMSS